MPSLMVSIYFNKFYLLFFEFVMNCHELNKIYLKLFCVVLFTMGTKWFLFVL